MRAVRIAALAAALLLSACADIGYLSRSVGGHLHLLQAAKPIQTWVDDDSQPDLLRQRLRLAQRMREFAVSELRLPVRNSYRAYADIARPFAVWNVVAAPELSLTLKTWCYPVMGCAAYRGYFEHAEAEAFAQSLQAPGMEVAVYGVPAYSTLGWTEWLGGDPLLSSFIHYPEGQLARMIFHEMAHQVVYVSDDTVFNESFATAVERIGARLWLQARASPATQEEFAATERRRADFLRLVQHYRERLDALFLSERGVHDKRRGKAELMAALRADYAQIKASDWGGFSGYDGWMARVNNATLGVLAAYNELTPQFEALFEREGRDFERFYAAVRRLARLSRDERRAVLAQHYAMERH